MSQFNRMVTSFLDFAEDMTRRKILLTMQDWESRLKTLNEVDRIVSCHTGIAHVIPN